jgi:diguanylate cyclase (GGDEF)-like protein
MIDLGQAPARSIDRRVALIGVSVMLLPGLAATPILGRLVGASYALFAVFVSLAIALLVISAVLLWAQARVARSRPLLTLAGVYAATAFVMVPYLLLYHGLWPALVALVSADPQTSLWLWLEWHVIFAASPAIYVAARRWSAPVDERAFRMFERRVVLVFTGLIALIVPPVIWIRGLPPYTIHGAWTSLASWSTVLVGGIALLSIVVVLVQNRFRSILDLWLAVASVLVLADVLTGRFGGGIFTVGWYISRGYVLAACGTLLTALILQTANVYAQLALTTERLRDESLTDVLTGLANRRRFETHLAQVMADGARGARAVAILMIDVDNFKAYNDAYGHLAGDRCLSRIAAAARKSVPRASDLVARFGGEELVVVLAETELAGAAVVAERIRNAIERLCIPQSPVAVHGLVTVSIGIAAAGDARAASAGTLLAEADRALYNAKRAGRNCSTSANAFAAAAS